MALTPSTMPALGMSAPAFTLADTLSEQPRSLELLKGAKATVVMFLSNHCPYVRHIQEALVKLALDYRAKGVGFAAVCSSDVETYPEDSPDRMRVVGQRLGFPFPYLYDETQDVARAYEAACTPDFFVFDAQLRLVYRGQFDDSRPGNDLPVNGRDLRVTLNALLAGTPVSTEQKPSTGCGIKWREEWLPGTEAQAALMREQRLAGSIR
ncbi:MAG TPA: thioredoxin family protein [Nevskia sp.]|nr:thioredoxin family protein [Nevskia sp.]